MKRSPDPGPYLGASLSRRHFLEAAAVSGLLIPLEAAAAPDQVHDLRGKVTINNRPATYKSDILPGDRVATGNDGHFVFVMGQDAVMLRSRSELVIERYEDSQGLLKLLTGAMGAVFGRGKPRRIVAANVTAGIRGTGVYMETRGDGTYFCTCWGAVDLASSDDAADRRLVESRRHIANLVTPAAREGSRIHPAASRPTPTRRWTSSKSAWGAAPRSWCRARSFRARSRAAPPRRARAGTRRRRGSRGAPRSG